MLEPPVPGGGGRLKAVTLVLLAALTLVVFLPTLRNQFLPLGFDDALILDTPALHALGWPDVRALMTESYEAHYVPLTMLSLAVDRHFWGVNPVGYHLTNVVLHAATAVLLCMFLWSIAPSHRSAVLAAAMFAVHPLQMEAVSVAVQRKTVLAGALWFMTLILYQRWRQTHARRWYGACLVAYAAAALAKPAVMPLPLFLLLYEYAFGGSVRLRPLLPFFAIAVFAGCMTLHAHEAVGGLHPPHGGSLVAHALMVSRVMVEYVDAALLPVGLSPLYYYRQTMIYDPVNFLALALVPAVAGYVTLYRRRYGWSFFCLWWFLLALAPESNLVPLAQLRADRFLYLALPALALWVSLAWEWLLQTTARTRWRRFAYASGPLAVGVLAVACYQSAAVWHDDLTAWTRVVERHPWCAVAHQMLGRAYYDSGDAPQAERELRMAMRISDRLPDTYFYLAQLYSERGATGLAWTNLQRFLQLAPGDPRGTELQGTMTSPEGS